MAQTKLSGRQMGNVVAEAITYYVAPAGQATASYDGAGAVAVSPSDSNDGLTPTTPLATIAAARDKFAGKILLAPVTIQLADTDAGNAYFPDAVEFSNIASGGEFSSILEKALAGRDDTYPEAYIYIKGNTSTPNNVLVTGAATAAGTTSTKQSAFVARNTNLRVRGMKINYFRANDADTGAINGYNSRLYVETINTTSDHTGNDGSLVSGFFNTIIQLGGSFNVTNSAFVRANAGSYWQTYSPLGYASGALSADSAVFMMFTNEHSHGFFQGGTWTFSGTGAYYAHVAWTNSSINWNADAVTSITYNAANATGLYAAQGSKIWEGAGTNMTVTVTALSRRAQARSFSYVHYGGTTAATNADLADGGSLIANGSFPFAVKTIAPDLISGLTEETSVADGDYVMLFDTSSGKIVKMSRTNFISGVGGGATLGANTFTGSQLWTAPSNSFRADNAQSRLEFFVAGDTSWKAPVFSGNKARGTTYAGATATLADDTLFELSAGGHQGASGWIASVVRIVLEAAGNFSDTLQQTRIRFLTNNGDDNPVERLRIDHLGNVTVGTAAIATNATDGFLYITSGAGKPTGTPTTYTGRIPLYVDTTNNKLYYYNSGWKLVQGDAAITLTDAATVTIDATTGNKSFKLSTASSRTLGAPGAGYDGQVITVRVKNTSGGSITTTLTTGASNAFRYGSVVTAFSAIAAGKTRYFTAQYNSDDSRWDVLSESGEF
jgi:hypothetical protein